MVNRLPKHGNTLCALSDISVNSGKSSNIIDIIGIAISEGRIVIGTGYCHSNLIYPSQKNSTTAPSLSTCINFCYRNEKRANPGIIRFCFRKSR